MSEPALTTAAWRPWWLYLALVLLFVGLSIPYGRKALDHRSALVRWQEQLLQAEQGVDIASKFNYPNPPIMALILLPFAKLPEWLGRLGISERAGVATAGLAWFYLKAALTLLVLRWVFRLVEGRGRPFPTAALVAAALLSMRPVISDLQHGNVNLFVLFLVVAALTAFVRGHDFMAGIVLGLAIACKVTPALFVPYFLWKRAYKALLGTVAGLALFLWPGVVPDLYFGHEHNQQLLVSWYKDMVHPFVIEGKVTSEHHNQSLPGVVARLTTHSPSFSTYDAQQQYLPTHYDNLLDLDPAAARWLVKGCMALFALLVVWACRTPISRRGGSREGWRLAAEFSIVLLGMLLFSERTWKHHCVTLMLPFAVLCYFIAVGPSGKTLKAYLAGTLAIVVVLIAATSTGLVDERAGEKDLYLQFAKKAQVYGAFAVANVVLLTALAVLLRRPAQDEHRDPAPALLAPGCEKVSPPAQAGAA
jgi:hypothetical protein